MDEGEREIFSLEELAEVFSLEGLSKSSAIFDIEKLTWMNGVYLRNMDIDKYYELVKPYIYETVDEKYD